MVGGLVSLSVWNAEITHAKYARSMRILYTLFVQEDFFKWAILTITMRILQKLFV